MKLIQLYSDRVDFDTNKLYRIPKMIQDIDTRKGTHYSFKFGAEVENYLYGTCLGYNFDISFWEFERYPDKTKVTTSCASVDMAYRVGIYEFESEEEMIMDAMK